MKKLLISAIAFAFILSGCSGADVSSDRYDCITNYATGETISLRQTKKEIDKTLGEGELSYDNIYKYGNDLQISYIDGHVDDAMAFDNWRVGDITFDMTREEVENTIGAPLELENAEDHYAYYVVNGIGQLTGTASYFMVISYGFDEGINFIYFFVPEE